MIRHIGYVYILTPVRIPYDWPGAALTVWGENKTTVSMENNTSILKTVLGGRLRCTARPLPLGKRSHVWEAGIHDD